jgi:hypothetical protein
MACSWPLAEYTKTFSVSSVVMIRPEMHPAWLTLPDSPLPVATAAGVIPPPVVLRVGGVPDEGVCTGRWEKINTPDKDLWRRSG